MIRHCKNFVVSGAAALGMLTSTVVAAQYALIVGINDYPGSQNDLSGCLRDVQNVTDFLKSQGFPQENMLILKDSQATAAGIEGAFKSHLIAKAKPGDSVVFFFSGHGTQVPDLEDDPDEDDDADECICAYDINPRRRESWMTDDRLRGLISQIKTDRILIMLDCCHAGTGTRSFSGQSAVPGGKYMHLGFDRPERVTRNFSISQTMRSPGTTKGHTLLAACASAEVARDSGAATGGIFTSTFLAEAKQNPNATLKAVIAKVNTTVANFIERTSNPSSTQTPQLEGAGDATVAEFFGSRPSTGFTQAAATATPPPATASNAAAISSQSPISGQTSQPHAPQSAFPLTLTASQDYQDGEFMTCKVNSAKDGYLRLYYTDSEQKTYMIFPNKLQQADGCVRIACQHLQQSSGEQTSILTARHVDLIPIAATDLIGLLTGVTCGKDQMVRKGLCNAGAETIGIHHLAGGVGLEPLVPEACGSRLG